MNLFREWIIEDIQQWSNQMFISNKENSIDKQTLREGSQVFVFLGKEIKWWSGKESSVLLRSTGDDQR